MKKQIAIGGYRTFIIKTKVDTAVFDILNFCYLEKQKQMQNLVKGI